MTILKIKVYLALILYWPLITAYKLSQAQDLIDQDIDYWWSKCGIDKESRVFKLSYLLLFKKQFRNLLYFRCPKIPNTLARILCPPSRDLYLAQNQKDVFNEIEGGGVYFEHSFGTRIRVRKMGKGCMIRQLSTFGVKSTNQPFEVPSIGNNVDFGANVTIIGNITIGDNAIIGAGSVVTKSIPANAIVAGNPAQILRYRTDI